jgi:hypothetical protein
MSYPEAETIQQARDALGRLQAAERTSWADWLLIGRALLIARRDCMLEAKANSPYGWRYNQAMGAWSRENGLAEISGQDRHKVLECLAHEDAIESWRATLTDVQRRRWNHPNSIWLHFAKAFAPGRRIESRTKSTTRTTVRNIVTSEKPLNTAAPDQDTIRRIAAELRENWTQDVYKLALVAYYAVMRPAPPPKPAHRLKAEAGAAHQAA